MLDGIPGMDETCVSDGSTDMDGMERGQRPPVRVAVTELRDELAEWLNRVAWGGETLLVHRRGRPLALVVPFHGEASAVRGNEAGAAPDSAGASPVPPPFPGRGGEEGAGTSGSQSGGEGSWIGAEPAGEELQVPVEQQDADSDIESGTGPGGAAAPGPDAEPGVVPEAEPGDGARGAEEDDGGNAANEDERERDREDLRAIFRAIAASAGEVPRAWRPVRPDGPRVRLLAAAARELRVLGGERRAAAERLLDLLAAGSLEDVPPLPGTGGRVYRFTPDTGGGLLWRREEDGSFTVLVVRPPDSDET